VIAGVTGFAGIVAVGEVLAYQVRFESAAVHFLRAALEPKIVDMMNNGNK